MHTGYCRANVTNTSSNTEYFKLPLSREDLAPDPIVQFSTWYSEAQAKGEIEPSAMSLATVNKNYDVSVRMLLLKSFDQNGFVFFTNYLSPKAQCLSEIPQAAMVFWWPLCQRQVRISGKVQLLNEKDSDAYFNQRSRDSRIAAIISTQSAIIPNREYLTERFQSLKEKTENQALERPAFWGGYTLSPYVLEFWQGRAHRLHDRFQYSKTAHGWEIAQLSP